MINKIKFLGIVLFLLIVSVILYQNINNKLTLDSKAESVNTEVVMQADIRLENIRKANVEILVGQKKERQDKAMARQKLMVELMKNDVNQFMAVAIPKKVSSKFEPGLRKFVESEVSLSGILEQSYSDNFESNKFALESFIKLGDGKRYRLYYGQEKSDAKTGSKVNIKGYQIGSQIAVLNETVVSPAAVQEMSIETMVQNRKLAVVLVNFIDNNNQPWIPSDIQKWTFDDPNSVVAYFRENSFDSLQLTGDVYGWYALPITIGSGCPYQTIATEAKKKMVANGADPNLYDHIIYAFPTLLGCDFSGYAILGGKDIWINGYYHVDNQVNPNVDVEPVIHELGHGLGLKHANAYSCRPVLGGPRYPFGDPQDCTSTEYDDPFDVMGGAYSAGHINAYSKGKLGFFNPDNMLEVSTDGQYSLVPMESQSDTGVQSLRVPAYVDPTTNKSMYYYLEYRQPVGIFDNFTTDDPVGKGILIRLAPDYSVSNMATNLIDVMPDSYSMSDAPLTVGTSVSDNVYGIKFETMSVSSTNAVVSISRFTPPCVRAVPLVSINPVEGWGMPGENVQFYVEVTNKDSFSCGGSTFSIGSGSTLPNGWTTTLPSPLVVDPGFKKGAYVYIKSPTSAPLGRIDFSEIVTHGSDPTKTAAVNASYLVYSSVSPTISFVSPVNNQTVASGTVPVIIEVQSENKIAEVYLLDNNSMVGFGTTMANGNYLFSPNLSTGIHTLQAEANDIVYNYGSSSITIGVGTSIAPTLTPTPTKTPTPTPVQTIIDIYALGRPYNGIYPRMELQLNTAILKRWVGVKGTMTRYRYILNRRLRATDSLRINYTNDTKTPGTTGRNLRVDRIAINGKVYQTEAASVYSTGTYVLSGNSCKAGYLKSEWLHCNGYFKYKL